MNSKAYRFLAVAVVGAVLAATTALFAAIAVTGRPPQPD
jgi:hypothetical protein